MTVVVDFVSRGTTVPFIMLSHPPINIRDKFKYYDCPRGYHWAFIEEGKKIFKNNDNWSNQCVDGVDTNLEVIFDTISDFKNAHKHSGDGDEYRVQFKNIQ